MRTTLAAEGYTGPLPVWEGRLLYIARIDPHLVSGCEVSLDIDNSLLDKLEAILTFLRRLLRLQSRSMRVILFSETGIAPLAYRRASLALRYLSYLVQRPHSTYVACAMRESFRLAEQGNPSWVSDLHQVLHKLCGPVSFTYNTPPSLAVIASMSSLLDQAMERWIQEQIEESPKTYLLRGRLEPCPNRPAIHKTLTFRHYVSVVVPNHRFALRRMLLSNHPLALERGR